MERQYIDDEVRFEPDVVNKAKMKRYITKEPRYTKKYYGTQGLLLMRGCWWNCWEALKTFQTIENAKKYNGKARFSNAGMLMELLESIENL